MSEFVAESALRQATLGHSRANLAYGGILRAGTQLSLRLLLSHVTDGYLMGMPAEHCRRIGFCPPRPGSARRGGPTREEIVARWAKKHGIPAVRALIGQAPDGTPAKPPTRPPGVPRRKPPLGRVNWTPERRAEYRAMIRRFIAESDAGK